MDAPERIWATNAKQTGYRFYANGPQPEFDGVEYVRADLAALPAVAAPGVRVKPTDAQVASACMSYRHDFGLLSDDERKTVMFQAREWLHAWQKEIAALDTPAPALMAELVEALMIAGPIALSGFANHPFVLNEDEKRKVSVVSAVLAKIGGA